MRASGLKSWPSLLVFACPLMHGESWIKAFVEVLH